MSSANFGKTWRRVRDDAGLPEIHFHDLRHAAATLAAQSGATLKDTMARLGHSTPRAALIYQHAASDRDEAIAKALEVARVAPFSQAAEEDVDHGHGPPTSEVTNVIAFPSRRDPQSRYTRYPAPSKAPNQPARLTNTTRQGVARSV